MKLLSNPPVFAVQPFLGVVYAFINHCIESGRPQRVNLMLRNGIVDAAPNESVLMVESVNANNSTRWFHAVFPHLDGCSEIPSALHPKYDT